MSEWTTSYWSAPRSGAVALLGPRQCGKTTLAREIVPPDLLNYFDLEDPRGLAPLSEPDTALRPLKKWVVIDEIQRRPDLFPLLRVLADRRRLPLVFSFSAALRPTCFASLPKLSPAASRLSHSKVFDCPIWVRTRKHVTGCADGSLQPTRRATRAIPWPGGGSSCKLSLSETCRNSALRFRQRPCGVSGTWLHTIMAKSGTRLNWPGP